MYSCAGPRSLGQVCFLGITLGNLFGLGWISQSCLSDPVFVLFHISLEMGTGGLDEDWSEEVEWCSGNIRSISKHHRNIWNIEATSATMPSAGTLLDAPDSPLLKSFDDDLTAICGHGCTCEIV